MKITVIYKEFKPSGKWTYDKELDIDIDDPNNWHEVIRIIRFNHLKNIEDGYYYVLIESKCGNYGYPHLIGR